MTEELETDFERVELALDDPFTISRGTSEVVENVLVRIEDGEHVGVGAAAPSARYDESAESVEAAMPDLLSIVEAAGDPHALDRIEREMRETVPGEAAARAGVSIALHDLVGKRLDLPLYRYLGLDPTGAPRSSYTIGIDSSGEMAEEGGRIVDAGFPILKVKLDGERVEERIEAVREAAPEATIRVDANEAWAPEGAIEATQTLAAHDVEFVEQPVPADDPGGLKRVHDGSPVPIAVDESCLVASDVPAIADRADVVVAKLAKAGGVREALRIAEVAHAHGLDAMLGCMVESNASIAAGCHLAPAFEYTDLDGALLLAEDPYGGVAMPGGEIDLDGSGAGTGARRR